MEKKQQGEYFLDDYIKTIRSRRKTSKMLNEILDTADQIRRTDEQALDRDKTKELIEYYKQAYRMPEKQPEVVSPSEWKKKAKERNFEPGDVAGYYGIENKEIGVLNDRYNEVLNSLAHEFLHARDFEQDEPFTDRSGRHFKRQPKYSPNYERSDALKMLADQLYLEHEVKGELENRKMLENRLMERLTGGMPRGQAIETLFPVRTKKEEDQDIEWKKAKGYE
jgi:hypothetical protein